MLKRVTVEYYKWINEETGEEFTDHKKAIESIIQGINDEDIEFFAENGDKYTFDELFDYQDYQYIDEDDFYAVKVKTEKGVEFVKKFVQSSIRELIEKNGIGDYIWDNEKNKFVNYDLTMIYYEKLYNQYFNNNK